MEKGINRYRNKKGYLKRDFEIFHIKDKKDLKFQFHYHDFNKIIIFISGKVTYLIEGKAYKLKPWDILLVNSNEIHKAIIEQNEVYERIIIWVNSDFIIKHNQSNCDLFTCFNLASKQKINLLRLNPYSLKNVKSILYNLELARKDEEFGSHILSNSLFLQFIVYLNRLFLDRSNIEELSDIQYDKSIGEILNYINENLSEDLSIEKLASIFYTSKYYLMHKFKMQTGYTVHNYIVQKRLIMANSLVKKGSNITEAAIESGFKDYSTFLRAFKKTFGMSPKKYFKT
ncbi:AraC family transcriptional regulator [Clostridium tetanomorphum]|uniref:AraC family transcriptional regulator n=1 Tax=Clostridium tetanomorphum TaxID=1553 RepID=A0A923E740_CLOTT|nr:AraC family transcriptional regulator [Clostridium tetanomorphum]MBC2397742.1 AraC family transcriptional regulator [Clostridium tetanomorphum]NRZ96505.1 AraC-like DNA-binding protein [Clostridium tetanomorphum]